MGQDNTFPVFCYAAAAILAVVLLFGIRFERDLRNSPLWFRAANLVLAINILVWSALGFTLIFYSAHFTTHTRAALIHCKWMCGGITLGVLISLAFSRIFQTRGLTNR
jgi:hypothetical protein